MALVSVCKQSEIPPGTLKFVSAGGKDLVVSNIDGVFYAIDNWCTHEQGNLSEGQLNGDVLTCPDHGAQFDVKTGKVLGGPDREPPDSIPPEKAYTVKVQGDDVMIEIP
jgi:3-phenylpropionate/trans-cinnamate dioxygenase ferredoxin subunit